MDPGAAVLVSPHLANITHTRLQQQYYLITVLAGHVFWMVICLDNCGLNHTHILHTYYLHKPRQILTINIFVQGMNLLEPALLAWWWKFPKDPETCAPYDEQYGEHVVRWQRYNKSRDNVIFMNVPTDEGFHLQKMSILWERPVIVALGPGTGLRRRSESPPPHPAAGSLSHRYPRPMHVSRADLARQGDAWSLAKSPPTKLANLRYPCTLPSQFLDIMVHPLNLNILRYTYSLRTRGASLILWSALLTQTLFVTPTHWELEARHWTNKSFGGLSPRKNQLQFYM